jgi:glycosyltransferase involved in cell wall biosynthesis
MKIAWIYPQRERCGIALYSRRYVDALEKLVEVCSFDLSGLACECDNRIAEINCCDLVHIQYETSFFMKCKKDFYGALRKKITPPVVVSLHEVYRTFPDVVPREQLRGPPGSLFLKRMLYDYRHPAQTAFRRHVSRGFCADKILVHQEYHKAILEKARVPGDIISVLPHPVKIVPGAPGFLPWDGKRPVHLTACGYINPHYNYNLLFSALRGLDVPWRFTWMGGVRRDEDQALLEHILQKVRSAGWQERFQITGWLPDEDLNKILRTRDVFCAFFKERSSSGTLATAIGACRPIVATELPQLFPKMHRRG